MIQSASGGGNDREDGEADYSEIKARLDRLQKKLDVRDREVAKAPKEEDSAARGRAMGIAFRIATDLIAGVAVGAFLGWLLDSWLGTAPILLIVFLLLGIAAGILNSVRAALRMQKDL